MALTNDQQQLIYQVIVLEVKLGSINKAFQSKEIAVTRQTFYNYLADPEFNTEYRKQKDRYLSAMVEEGVKTLTLKAVSTLNTRIDEGKLSERSLVEIMKAGKDYTFEKTKVNLRKLEDLERKVKEQFDKQPKRVR